MHGSFYRLLVAIFTYNLLHVMQSRILAHPAVLMFHFDHLFDPLKNIPCGLLVIIVPFLTKIKKQCYFLGHSFYRVAIQYFLSYSGGLETGDDRKYIDMENHLSPSHRFPAVEECRLPIHTHQKHSLENIY